MRQLTAYASYCDNLGELLIGRARFYNLDGSPAQVFGLDNAHEHFITLGTSVYTNSSGQLTPQVFLGDHDYLIVFDKYIGDGTMSEDDDPESWEEQGSAVDYYNTLGVELLGQTTRVVKTMDDLKDTQPLADDEIILLLGYNTPGDKPPIYYKWNASVIAQDNGGSVVQVGEQERGRWMFIECPVSLDVRHFGAFSSGYCVENTEQRYAIQRAGEYAHENNCGLYFPADDGGIYYDISGLTLYDVDCNPTVRVFATDDSQAVINGIEKIYCGGDTIGRITLTNPTVRSSWEGEYRNVVLNPTEKLIIDKELYPVPRIWTGIQVEMKTYCGPNATFDDCIITSNGAITGSITIQNCELKTEWFSDDYNWSNLYSYSNTILLQNCKDATTYVKLKNKQNDPHYGDLGEQTISNVTLLSNAVAENGMFTNVTIQNAVELHNISGTAIVSGAGTLDLNAIDCWLTINGNVVVSRVQLRRGNLSGSGQMQILQDSLFEDTTINKQLKTLGMTLTVKRCNVYASIQAQRLILHNSDIHAEVSQIDDNGTITIDCVGNVFGMTLDNVPVPARHYIHGVNTNCVVVGTWANNTSTYDTVHWIRLDRTNLKIRDTDHNYSYSGNNEPFLSKYNGFNTVMKLACYRGNKDEGRDIFRTTGTPFIFWNTYTNEIFVVNRHCHWRMFTVGRANPNRVCRIIPRPEDSEGRLESASSGRRHTPIIWMWGRTYSMSYSIPWCCQMAVSHDTSGEADYKWSFEYANADHNPDTSAGGNFSNGTSVGFFATDPTDDAENYWIKYPSPVAKYLYIAVEVERDFKSQNNGLIVQS